MKKHNIFRKELEEVLARLDRQNIKNSQQLQAQEQLTLVLWQAVENFVNCCALRSKTHLARDGQIQQGNADRLDELKKRGVDLEDVQRECLVHIFENLDLVFKKPLEVQCNYIFTIVNNQVVDEYRRYFPVLSLEEELGNGVFGETCRRMDLIAGPFSPEEKLILRQAALDGLAAARAEQLEKVDAAGGMICAWIRQERTRLCWEMRHLRNWPAEAFARLCSCYLDMKPSQAADLLILLGPDGACEAVLQKVARIYGVGRSAREKAVRRRPVRSDSLRLLALLEKLPLGEIQTLGDRELGRSPELRGILECFAGEELHTWEPEDFLLLSGTFSGGPRQEDVKLDTGDRKRISAQISRLSWRAGERLEKQRERQYTKVR